jgi:23S rRNA (uracil1939-C5)-methyltransferase
MQRLVTEACAGAGARAVADLFSGLGTFALPLARRAKVYAIDADAALLAALAAAGLRAEGRKPITTEVRNLFEFPLQPAELAGFDAAVFDPPRAGAEAQAKALAAAPLKTVVAVSCNPRTLARDLAILTAGGYIITQVTPLDQFVFSPHIEVVAVLSRVS